jgi:hypothetical protein
MLSYSYGFLNCFVDAVVLMPSFFICLDAEPTEQRTL